MWKSDFFSLVQLRFHEFLKMYGNLSMALLPITHTGIRDFRMSRMSGIEISSSQGLKKPPKMSPREVSFFFPRAYFKVFYNPRDEEISIPDINGHSENLFLFEFIYVQNLFFSVKSSCALVTRGEMVISPQARILPGEKLPFPRVTSAHDDFTEKK